MSTAKKLIIIFLVLLTGIISAGTVYAIRVYFQVEDVAHSIHRPIEGREEAEVIENAEPLSLLLLGIANDSRRKTDFRANTIMVATLNPATRKTTLTSIPRDAYVEIVGQGYHDKINHAHSFGGAKMMIETVEQYLDIPIHHYFSLNMDGMADLVDAIGGITVENEFAFTAEKIDYPEGTLELDGWEALQYTRMRKDDPEGDYGRQRRQREVTEILANELVSLSSVMRIQDLLTIIGDNGETDLTFSQMSRLFTQYQSALGTVESYQMAGSGFTGDGSRGEYGISYQEVTPEEQQTTSQRLKNELLID
ncbi:LCP family protein [Enterococcus casseliflavus]|uniref:LCP family glycopolymer transferase n=1 Tax=Enterococcus casseliflavus TaxID=37734 RepID=UPI001CA80B6F|nr:LCP family protein [Enterococcus casseliflavus]MBZ0322043.1 LCP family protein [Enterococcus casseliflavus]